MRKYNYAKRDEKGRVAFYVPLWKRNSITLQMFDDYWRNVHGPVCARLPGQHQYWQFHIAHDEGGIWPAIEGIDYSISEEDQFDGIAELTFESNEDRNVWFTASTILMADEHNLFRKAIGYNTSNGNSITYVDGIENGQPNGSLGVMKLHVMVKKANTVSSEDFRQYMKSGFAPAVVESSFVLKFRLHLFEEVDTSRPDAAGVSHYEALEKQNQAAFEIAFNNRLEMEKFFASAEYADTLKDQPKFIRQINVFPERTAYTFVYVSSMTISGMRGSTIAELITNIGATNQLEEDIVSLILGKK